MKLTQRPRKINRQIAGLITIILLVSLAFCIIANSCFLGDFFILQKQRNLKTVYTFLDNRCEGVLYDEFFTDEILSISEQYSISILIADENLNGIVSSNSNKDILLDNLKYCLDVTPSIDETLKENNYTILSTNYGDAGSSYLILLGHLRDGNIIFMRCSVTGIAEASKVANLFLIYIALIAIIISLALSNILIEYFTRPLFNMIDITKRISDFDFSAKYVPQKVYNELDDLGEHVNEMSTTLERSIEQLQRANEKLQKDIELRAETENMRKEFISNVSHELKTPIALIQGYAEGLQEGIMDDENSRQIYLDVILDESNKMSRLVKEMLVLNQLEAGQMTADYDEFNVTNIINGIIDNNKIYFEGQNIAFTFENNEPVYVRSDEVLVEQVFTNFMSNAIHYVTNENVITVRYEFTKKNRVRISVFNSGNNIPKKDIKHIWEKFYKVDKARSREYGGSGIGLSVVKAIMDLIHEKFGVENLPNGVEFWFELPLTKNVQIEQNS